MIYLSGCIRPDFVHPQVGFMFNPNMGNRIPRDRWWAADNGAFSSTTPFSWERMARWLRRWIPVVGDRCLFVVCPDVPFDADGTLARWAEHHAAVQAFGRPVAFVTQDGLGVEDVPWPDIDVLFVGGSTAWKLGHESAAIIAAAQARGMWVHVGRVNSLARLRAASSLGANSADGTFLKYGPDVNWPRLTSWLTSLKQQPPLLLPHALEGADDA